MLPPPRGSSRTDRTRARRSRRACCSPFVPWIATALVAWCRVTQAATPAPVASEAQAATPGPVASEAPRSRAARIGAWVVPEYNPDELAFSSDGKWLAMVGAQGVARVLDVASGAEVLRVPVEDAQDVAFAGSTLVVLSVSWAGEKITSHVHQLDVAAKKVVRTEAIAGRAELAPCGDGVVLASGDAPNGTVSLRRPLASAWTAKVPLRGTLACGGEVVAVAVERGVALFDRASGSSRGKLEVPLAEQDYVYGLAIDRSGSRIAAVTHRGEIRVWKPDGTLVASRPGLAGGKALDFSPDGSLLASGSILFDPATLAVLHREHRVRDFVRVARFTPDGAQVVRATTFAAVPHDVRALLATRPPDGPVSDLSSIAIDPSGTFAALGCKDGRVVLQELETGRVRRILEAHRGEVKAVRFLAPERLLTGGDDEALHEWDLATGRRLRSIDVPESVQVEEVRVSANGKRLLVRGWSRVTVFERDGRRVRTLGPFAGQNTSDGASTDAADLDAAGERVAITLDGRRVVLLRVADGEELPWPGRADEPGTGAPRFTPDDASLLVGRRDGAKLYRLADGSLVRTWADVEVGEGEFSPDGTQLLFWSWSGVLGVLPIAGEAKARWSDFAPWHVADAAWDPKRPRVWSVGPDVAITGWDRATGKKVKTIAGAIGVHVEALAFSADGKRLAAGHDRRLSVWDLEKHALVAEAAHDGSFANAEALALEGNVLTAIDGFGSVLTWKVRAAAAPRIVGLEDSPVHTGVGRMSAGRTIEVDRYSGAALVRSRSGDGKPKSIPAFDEPTMGELRGVAIDAERARIATLHVLGDGDDTRGELRVRDGTGRMLLTRAAPPFASIAFDRSGRLLVSDEGDDTGEKVIAPSSEWWTIATPPKISKWSLEPRAVHVLGAGPASFAPDGKRLAFFVDDQLWLVGIDGVLERVVALDSRGVLEELAWSPDGALIAIGTRHEGDIRVHDVASGAWRATYRLRKDGSTLVCVPGGCRAGR